MIYDEFAMKRIGGLCRQVQNGNQRPGPDGLTPTQELNACRAELRAQEALVARLVEEELRPALLALGIPIRDVAGIDAAQHDHLARYFAEAVEPILTPLAADAAHPFPFISNLGLNLAVQVTEPGPAPQPLRAHQGPDQPAPLGSAPGRGRLGPPGAGHRGQPATASSPRPPGLPAPSSG